MFRRRNNLLRTALSEETGTDSPCSYYGNSCGSGSTTCNSCNKDEFLEYYRQYRHPQAVPEGYLRRLHSSASLPIESYYSNGSHYHQRDTDMISNEEAGASDGGGGGWNPSPRPSYAPQRHQVLPPQRKHRWWAGTSSLLGSLKRKKKPKSRPNLGRIPDHIEPETGVGHSMRRIGMASGSCDMFGNNPLSPPPELYGSCYSTVGSEAGVASRGSLEADTQSRDSGKLFTLIRPLLLICKGNIFQ